jgi:hypothetical protein
MDGAVSLQRPSSKVSISWHPNLAPADIDFVAIQRTVSIQRWGHCSAAPTHCDEQPPLMRGNYVTPTPGPNATLPRRSGSRAPPRGIGRARNLPLIDAHIRFMPLCCIIDTTRNFVHRIVTITLMSHLAGAQILLLTIPTEQRPRSHAAPYFARSGPLYLQSEGGLSSVRRTPLRSPTRL